MMWLTQTPISIVQAMLLAIPRLQAEECLRGVHVGAIAAGTLEEKARKSLLSSWEQSCRKLGDTIRRKPTPMTPDAMAAFGFSVVFGPPAKAPEVIAP